MPGHAHTYTSMNEALADDDYWLTVADAVLVPLADNEEFQTGKIRASWEQCDIGIGTQQWDTVGTDYFNCADDLKSEDLHKWLVRLTEKHIGLEFHTGRMKINFRHRPSGTAIATRGLTIKSRISENERDAQRFQRQMDSELARQEKIVNAVPAFLNSCSLMMRSSAQQSRVVVDLVRALAEKEGAETMDESKTGSLLKMLGTLTKAIDADTADRFTSAGEAVTEFDKGAQTVTRAKHASSSTDEPTDSAPKSPPSFIVNDPEAPDGKREATPDEIRAAGYDPTTGEKIGDPDVDANTIQDDAATLERVKEIAKRNPTLIKA
ncbi:MAG: hypothetical protein ACE5FM_09400, partial [Methyloligellaceae bacterium]